MIGDPFDTAAEMGSLAAERRRDQVEGYIAKGKEVGATLTTDGDPSHLDKGSFVEPTVFGKVSNSATIAREEIFGPVPTAPPEGYRSWSQHAPHVRAYRGPDVVRCAPPGSRPGIGPVEQGVVGVQVGDRSGGVGPDRATR